MFLSICYVRFGCDVILNPYQNVLVFVGVKHVYWDNDDDDTACVGIMWKWCHTLVYFGYNVSANWPSEQEEIAWGLCL